MKMTIALALALLGAAFLSSCSRDAQAMSAEQIEQQYGVSGARLEGQLFIPQKEAREPHAVYDLVTRDKK
jgi:hypothetical protein